MKTKDRFIDSRKIFLWDGLKQLGQTKFAKLTIFVPFIGYFILFNETLSNYLFLNNQLVPVEITDNSNDNSKNIIRLYYLYFGFTFIGVGTFIFALVCPEEIRYYSNSMDFLDSRLKYMTNRRLRKHYAQLSEVRLGQGKEMPTTKEHKAILNYIKSMPDYDPNFNIDSIRSALTESHRELYWKIRCKDTYYRVIIIICYLLGFIFILIPSISMFWKISKNFVKLFLV